MNVPDAGEQAFAGRVLQESASELAQEAVVEAGIDEVERQQVLPVPDDELCSSTARASSRSEPGWPRRPGDRLGLRETASA